MSNPELTQAIAKALQGELDWHWDASPEEHIPSGAQTALDTAKVIAAAIEAHLRPVVTTVAELDALPRGAVVRDADGWVWVRKSTSTIGWATDDQTDSYFGAKYVTLPATVLYRPEAN